MLIEDRGGNAIPQNYSIRRQAWAVRITAHQSDAAALKVSVIYGAIRLRDDSLGGDLGDHF